MCKKTPAIGMRVVYHTTIPKDHDVMNRIDLGSSRTQTTDGIEFIGGWRFRKTLDNRSSIPKSFNVLMKEPPPVWTAQDINLYKIGYGSKR